MSLAFWNIALANAGAAVGENIAQLIARYGDPENGFALMMGFGSWKTKQGGEIQAFLEDGKAAVMIYSGGVDEKTKKSLLERNLPTGQTWVNGKDFKAFVLSHKALDPDPKEIEQVQFWQTADGKLWAAYSPREKNLVVATPEGFKKMESLAETRASGGF